MPTNSAEQSQPTKKLSTPYGIHTIVAIFTRAHHLCLVLSTTPVPSMLCSTSLWCHL